MLKRLIDHPKLEGFWLLSRFGLAGLVNTAIGLSAIAALDLGLNVDPHIANAIGFLGGIASGYALNREFVFRSRGAHTATGWRYVATVALGFAANQTMLAIAGKLLGEGDLPHLGAQVCGMATYTSLTFLLYRFWVFSGRRSDQRPSRSAKASTAEQVGSNT